jgi:hypothetical protein
MLCFLCGKKIGFFRSMMDQQYCSAEHRKEARLASAQALRDEDDQEPWSVAKNKKKNPGKTVSTPGQTASVFAFLTVGALLVAAMVLPGPSGGGAYPPVPSLDPAVKRGPIDRVGDAFANLVRSQAPITLHDDFTKGLKDWTTVVMRNVPKVDDPKGLALASAPNIIRPGSLRIWDRSVALQNYQLEFKGELARKSLSWAFRASDAKNYYATKIMITKPGPLPNAGLVRYVMMNGRVFDQVQLPIPVTLERGGNYKVRVSVQDDRFITYLNGQVISSWSDKRLHRGGVGFFSDEDDPQKVDWVSLSERDSFLGKVLAHFSMIVMPGAQLQ